MFRRKGPPLGWRNERTETRDGVVVRIEENLDTGERLVTMSDEAGQILTMRVADARWRGHCYGALLLPDMVARAKELRAREVSNGSYDNTEAFNFGTQAGELGHPKANPYTGGGFAWRAFEAGYAYGCRVGAVEPVGVL